MNNPPVIIIYYDENSQLLREVKAGIEEESVFFKAVEYRGLSCEDLAKEASTISLLGIGIGIYNKTIALIVEKLNEPLIHIQDADFNEARRIGCNAARYAKGISLK